MPAALLAPLLIPAPVAGRIKWVDGRFAPVDRPELVKGREKLAPVPGLTPEENAIVEGRQ